MKRWSTVLDFIASGKAPTSETVVSFEGWAVKGDGGNSLWVKTGGTDTPSQTPTARGNNTFTDSAGFVYTPVDGQVFRFNGDAWFPSPFGDSGEGLYQFNGASWDFYDRVENIITTYADTATMQAASPSALGQRAENRERGYAQYELKDLDYVPLPGDVTAANGRVWALQLSGGANVAWFGAVGDGVADDTQAIQDAISRGGYVYSRDMTHRVSRAATDPFSGRGYCLSVDSNTTLDFGNSKITNLADDNDTDIIITLGAGSYENIEITSLEVDGEAVPNDNVKKGFCLWLRNIAGLRLSNIKTVNSRSWGVRIQACDRVDLRSAKTTHGPNINADGIHFIDTNNVVGNNIDIYTEGDDGFIIEALYSDVENYNITGLNVEANVSVASAGRGVFIFQEENVNPAILGMKNIKINGVVKNCKGGAFVTSGALNVLNMDIDISSSECEYGMYLQYGSSVNTDQGSIKNSSFKGLISNTTKNGFFMNPLNSSVAELCDFNIRVYNPADGFTGATIKGQEHTGSFVVDYDPFASKASHSNGVQLDATDCDLYVMCKGANNNLQFADNAQRNNIRIGNLKDAVVSDVAASSSVNCFENNVYGGSIATLTQNGALRNRFYHTRGATFESRDNLTPDGSGAVSVAHGLPAAPRRTQITTESNSVQANLVSTDATNINLEIRGFGGALVTSGSYRVNIQTQVDF